MVTVRKPILEDTKPSSQDGFVFTYITLYALLTFSELFVILTLSPLLATRTKYCILSGYEKTSSASRRHPSCGSRMCFTIRSRKPHAQPHPSHTQRRLLRH